MNPWKIIDRISPLIGFDCLRLSEELFIHIREKCRHRNVDFILHIESPPARPIEKLRITLRIEPIRTSFHRRSLISNFQIPAVPVPLNNPPPPHGPGRSIRVDRIIPLRVIRLEIEMGDGTIVGKTHQLVIHCLKKLVFSRLTSP